MGGLRAVAGSLAFAWVALGSAQLPARADDVARPQRPCTDAASVPDSAFARTYATLRARDPSDAAIEDGVRQIIATQKPRDVAAGDYTVAMLGFDDLGRPSPTGERRALLRSADGSYVLATIDARHQVASVAPAATDDVRHTFDQVRFFAAFEFLSDVTVSDAQLPRATCARRFRFETAVVPALTQTVVAAALAVPDQDARAIDAARKAYAAFTRSTITWRFPRDATAETVAALGPEPATTLVYRDAADPRDPALDPGSDLDIVRFGDDAKHAYAIVLVAPDGTAQIATSALCLVGDPRCTTNAL